MTIDLLKQNLITAAEIKDAAERVKAYRGVLTDAIDYIYESTNTHKPEKASLLELVDSDVLANYVQDSDVINSLHYVRILGMNAEHDQKIKKTADKLAYDNLAYFIGLIEAQEKGTRAQYQKPPYMSEANTRKLYIDLYLKEAGWDVLDTENVAIAGKAGIEIKVEGMIVDCFHELYPEHPANYCQLIDNYVKYADDLILKFENDDEFRIAVSVDMLDTGIDVPAVVNLVFFKPVKSKIKFVQMIGRGTRLCENLFGEGKDKTHFIIFDYCGNFEYFDAHPDGTDGMGGRSLSQRLFEVRLDILHELQRIEYQEQEFARSYYNKTKDLLHAAVYKIKGHSARMQVRAEMQYVDKYSDYATWESVSPLMVKEIKVHITPLLDSGLEGFDLSIAFDIRMLDIELSMLVQGNTGMATRDVKTVRQVAQYLLTEKASIPQVFAKAEQLKTLVSEQFWDAPSLEKLEQLRVDVRDLMQFLDKSPKKQIDVNIDDTVEPSGYDGGDTIIDIRTYREKVLDYLIEHSDNEVIHKIQRLEPITNEDLKALEKILWEELGTKEEYEQTTDIDNLAVFVRSLIGLSQEAVNEKFGEYLNGNVLNAQQQEFIRAIINYVRENGDISREDLIEKSPFDNYDILTLFGDNITSVLTIVGILHDSVNVAA